MKSRTGLVKRTDGAPEPERGITLVIGALTMVTLMIFASFAIDFGALYNHRRIDQNAADSGALAAAQDLGRPVATMVTTAKHYVEDTLGIAFTAQQWNSCAADGGSLLNRAPGSNCISYTSDQVRVRVPDQQFQTFFARVIGANQFRHSAFAVAGLQPEGFGGVLPFGVTGSAGNGGFSCLQSNSNGQASSVCGSISGNFRFLDFGMFGSSTLHTPNACSNGGPNGQDPRLRQHVAMGIDHQLSLYGGPTPLYDHAVVDTEACVPPQTPSPNSVFTRTGNQSDDATTGMFSGSAGNFFDQQPARLQRSNPNLLNNAAPQPVTVLGVSGLDNTPIWDFIPSGYGPSFGNADIPRSCQRNTFVNGAGNFSPDVSSSPMQAAIESLLSGRSQGDQAVALIQRCFSHFMGQAWSGFPVGTLATPEPATGCSGGVCNDPVFAVNSVQQDPELYDIQYTPRFGYVPVLDNFGTGTNAAHIVGYRAIFIQRLFLETNSGGVTWDPGISAPSGGSAQRLGETSMFVFPTGILPGGLAETTAPGQVGTNVFVRLIR